MGQYTPRYQVGQIVKKAGRAGQLRYSEINRRPHPAELDAARAAAHDAGLWRLDERAGSMDLAMW